MLSEMNAKAKGNLPKVSIITPSYCQEQFIERTILSVLKQDYPNVEYIVMDGGSTDNTLEILKRYRDRLIWKSELDRGQSHAINKGFLMASGDILAWLNSDDTYKPAAISTAVQYLIEHPEVDVVYGDGEIIDLNDKLIGVFKSDSANLKEWLYNGKINVFQPSVFFKRTVIDKIGLIDETLQYNMDHDYWIRMAFAGLNLKYVEIPLASLRWHENAKTHQIIGLHKRLHLKLLRKYSLSAYLFYYFRYILLISAKKKIFGNRKLFSGKNKRGQSFF